jgi:hypothetical protein
VLVAGQLGELAAPVAAGVVQVKALELAEAELVEQNHQGHQLRQAQAAWPAPLLRAVREQPPLPGRLERAAKIVNQAKKFGQRVHGRLLFER